MKIKMYQKREKKTKTNLPSVITRVTSLMPEEGMAGIKEEIMAGKIAVLAAWKLQWKMTLAREIWKVARVLHVLLVKVVGACKEGVVGIALAV